VMLEFLVGYVLGVLSVFGYFVYEIRRDGW
jgi:hypothetical protein